MKPAKTKPVATTPEATTSEATKAEASVPAEPPIRSVKIASCPSLSGKSTLKYNVGCTPDSTIYFRVFENSGGGFFSHEWIPLGAIQKALDKASSDTELTSFLLHPLFSGRSQNSPGFLLAAVKAEGLVRASTKKRRCYERADDSVFLAEVQAWMASGAGPKVETKVAKGKANGRAMGKGKAAKAMGEVPPTASTRDLPVKVEVAMPQPVMADIVPTVQPEKPKAPTGTSKAVSGRPPKKKAK
jgi:hypothetical protein